MGADVAEFEVGVLLGGNGQVGQPSVLLGQLAVLLAAGQLDLRPFPCGEVPVTQDHPERGHRGDGQPEESPGVSGLTVGDQLEGDGQHRDHEHRGRAES